MLTELHAIVTGTVQGVGYRDFVRAAAEDLDIVGWVRNRDDGAVEILAQGYPDALRTFQAKLSEGSVLARIVGIATEIRTLCVVHDSFSVRV